jgi:hypothetical protein
MVNRIRAFLLIIVLAAFSQSASSSEAVKNAENNAPDTKKETVIVVSGFRKSLENALARRGSSADDSCDQRDSVSRRVLNDYGAIFLAGERVLTPPVCIFTNAREVDEFQRRTQIARSMIGGVTIELQDEAMKSLLAARREAVAAGLDITPRDGAEAARRAYEDTVRLWNSRFFPALRHWQRRGKITAVDSERLSSLPVREQVAAVLELERGGVFFSRDFSKSILYSVAAPGSSQHLSLLAFDANEYAQEKVRRILARHGWFRTVKNDEPHFTFLGLAEKDLPAKGLRKLKSPAGEFWIPNIK